MIRNKPKNVKLAKNNTSFPKNQCCVVHDNIDFQVNRCCQVYRNIGFRKIDVMSAPQYWFLGKWMCFAIFFNIMSNFLMLPKPANLKNR